MLKMTKDPSQATAITHAGTFHADEVFATVILARRFPNLVVCRVTEVPEGLPSRTIVYDIGYGPLDHHQPRGAGKRSNGVPYAACGLVWKKYGKQILSHMKVKDVYRAWAYIDSMLVQGIDAIDNGVLPNVEYPSQALTISSVISGFNPTWNETFDPDNAFMSAVNLASITFNNLLRKIISSIDARDEMRKAIDKNEGNVLVLDRYIPWVELFREFREDTDKYLFVVYPSNRGGWSFCAVNTTTRFEHRKDAPRSWWGLSGDELRGVTGVATATFVHPNGFIGGAETREDAIRMASLAAAA